MCTWVDRPRPAPGDFCARTVPIILVKLQVASSSASRNCTRPGDAGTRKRRGSVLLRSMVSQIHGPCYGGDPQTWRSAAGSACVSRRSLARCRSAPTKQLLPLRLHLHGGNDVNACTRMQSTEDEPADSGKARMTPAERQRKCRRGLAAMSSTERKPDPGTGSL